MVQKNSSRYTTIQKFRLRYLVFKQLKSRQKTSKWILRKRVHSLISYIRWNAKRRCVPISGYLKIKFLVSKRYVLRTPLLISYIEVESHIFNIDLVISNFMLEKIYPFELIFDDKPRKTGPKICKSSFRRTNNVGSLNCRGHMPNCLKYMGKIRIN